MYSNVLVSVNGLLTEPEVGFYIYPTVCREVVNSFRNILSWYTAGERKTIKMQFASTAESL